MWIKFLYFLRIFKQTGYLIDMISKVVYDMGAFLIVLLVALMAFADALNNLSQANILDDQFVSSYIDSILYTYRLILGDFDTSEFGNVSIALVWIVFILCTIFNMIIMLNLLISIISDTFARVKEN